MDRLRPNKWLIVSYATAPPSDHRDLKIDSGKLYRGSRMPKRKQNMTDTELKEWLETQYDLNDNGCWVWRHSTSGGYGHVKWKGTYHYVHRVYWLLSGRTIPEGLGLLHGHGCSKACYNPAHLHPGDQSENTLDKHRDGTMPCKLTKEQVLEIRARTDKSKRGLAKEYGVSYRQIWAIKTGKSWGWL